MYKKVLVVAGFLRYHLATRPHNYLLNKSQLYKRWHNWNYSRLTNITIAGGYILLILVFVFGMFQQTFATSDINNTWNFSNPSDYTATSGAEITGNTARLKAQNYANDANTSALYHLDDNSGSSASDSSSNGNTLSLKNSPTWATGRLNSGVTLNGTTQYATASDSSSLSLSQQNSIEAQIKLNSKIGRAHV